MGNKVKSSTKKFVKNKLAGAIKKRREKQQRMPRAVIQKKDLKKEIKQDLVTSEPDVGVDENAEGEFEEYLQKELADFEIDEEDEEDDDEQVDEDDDDEEGDDLQEQHNAELQQLRETDPEFFAFLQKNDPSLLQFGEDEDEDKEEEPEERPAWVGRTGKKAVAKGCREFELACKRLTGEGVGEEDEAEHADETVVRWGLGPGLRLAAQAGQK
jgi:nucleolar complex protein 2